MDPNQVTIVPSSECVIGVFYVDDDDVFLCVANHGDGSATFIDKDLDLQTTEGANYIELGWLDNWPAGSQPNPVADDFPSRDGIDRVEIRPFNGHESFMGDFHRQVKDARVESFHFPNGFNTNGVFIGDTFYGWVDFMKYFCFVDTGYPCGILEKVEPITDFA